MQQVRAAAVVGPTASGKTALAAALALRLNGEVVSCDSMQIYRHMDIGTAKPSPDETMGVPHHLIDVCEPSSSFSAAEYAALASETVRDIRSRGKLPILCGGTGLYLDALQGADAYADAEPDEALRASLLSDAEKYGADDLWRRLYEVDPETAVSVHPNNVRRVARALEIWLSTGRTKTDWDRQSRLAPKPFELRVIGIDRDRNDLYGRIDRRAGLMLEAGLVDEVRALLESGSLPRSSTAAQAIGYKEIIAYLDGSCTLEEAADEIRQSSRRYAKRQLTWFRRIPGIRWITVPASGPEANFENIVNIAEKLLTNDGFCDIIR